MDNQTPTPPNNLPQASPTTNNVSANSGDTADINNINPQPRRFKFRKLSVILMLVVIVGIVAVVFIILSKPSHKTAQTNKKDIPLLRVGLEASGQINDYPVKGSSGILNSLVALQMYEGLVGYKNETQMVPLLAQSWSNPDNNSWVFNLRQNVKFHTGRPMTAQDVKFTLDYAVAHREDVNSYFNNLLPTVDKVTVNNPYQITIHTQSPTATLLNDLGYIGIVDSKAVLGDYNSGTGPYVLKDGTKPSDTSIDLVAGDNYWQGHVYTREVKIQVYSSLDKMTADAASGKLDLSGAYDGDQLKSLSQFPSYNLPDLGVSFIGMNTRNTKSPLSALAARQAVAYALDIPSTMKLVGLKGILDNQIVPPMLAGYNPAIKSINYDPAKARELLGSVPNASAQITFAYLSVNEASVKDEIKQLSAVGFNIKGVPYESFDDYLNDATLGKFDLFTYADTTTSDGLQLYTDLLTNNNNYDSPQIDKLIDDANNTLNANQRLNDMQQIAVIVDNDKPVVPLFSHSRVYVYANKNYTINTDLGDLMSSTYFWQTYQK